MASVELSSIRKSFGKVEAVRDVSLSIADRELVVFVGPSGCGKSTLLRLIAGLEEVTSGALSIGGKPMNKVPAADRGVAMVFQSYALYPHMTVAENMGFALKMIGVGKAEVEAKVHAAAAVLRLDGLLDRKPRQLSGGQRQRVAIGRAIMREPQLFLFDEPLSNLDAELRVQMRVELARLHKELGVTMIYVTHDQTEAMTLANRIVVLRDGSIEQIGTPLDLYHNPDNQFVAGFVGSPKMNFIPARVVELDTRGVTVELAGQERTRLTQPLAGAAPEPGSPVVVGVRPEHFGDAGKGDADLQVKVDMVEHLGGTSFVYASTATDDELVIQRDADQFADTAEMTVSIRKSYLFDEGGARLR